MKPYILLFFMIFTAAWANESLIDRPKLPLEISLPLLETIQPHALVIGSGPTTAHVFIDPVCPRSRDFVGLVQENAKMQSLYTYYFYFYALPRFHSEPLIEAIYTQKDPKSAMLSVMTQEAALPHQKADPSTQQMIQKIADVGAKIDVYKRPYMILVKPRKP